MKKKIKLIEIAHGRSGDKGDASNVGIIARHPKYYEFLKNTLTEEVVAKYFEGFCHKVVRYELPNLHALNFLLYGSLGGGGTVSLKLDAQGKTHAAALLRMEVEIDENLLKD
ncbi:MAG: hypothetical protein NZ519_02075 [Bacteroidia bacterium]|nr:hypothetical protein [Bacteroidia bacterium]MDW8302805.1 hypothetical protein [Bacteroidia bacterium]